jgi:hypothetical protein
MSDEQGRSVPIRITKWDYLSLFVETLGTLIAVISNFFMMMVALIDHHASFVEDEKTFHEYAARTIETLQEGE